VNRERTYHTEAVVLRRADFGEADRILTIYTPHLGKRRVIAKGVRKIGSRKAGHLEPFMHSRLFLARGRNLDIITQAETIHAFRPLREDLLRASYACYLADLLDSFVGEEVENPPLFKLLVETLDRLSSSQDPRLTARYYELHLLALVGYQPQFFYCVNCHNPIEPVNNFFHPTEGGVLCPRCGEGRSGARAISLNALKVLRFLQTRDYPTCMRLRLSTPLHDELEGLMHRYITYLLERNLKSVAFLRRLRREGYIED